MSVRSLAVRLLIAAGAGGLVLASGVSAAAAPVSPLARTVRINDVRGLESSGALSVRVTLAAPSTEPIAVAYETRAQRARPGADYEATSGQLVFVPGETESSIVVPIIDDRVPEPTETFRVVLASGRRARIADRRATVTVLDDDWRGTPVVSPATDLVDRQAVRITAKGLPPGLTLGAFECEGWVSPSHPYPGPCDVGIGSVTVDARGRVDTTLSVLRFFRFYDGILYDCAFEHCSLWLSESADGNAFGMPVALDFRRPDPVPKLSMDSIRVAEGPGAGTIAYVQIHLDRPADGPVVIFPGSIAATATAEDFSVGSYPISIPAGSTEAVIPVYVVNDGVVEADEVFAVIARSVSGAELGNGGAFVTIVGDA